MQELSYDDFVNLTAEGKFRKLMHAHNQVVSWINEKQEKPLNRLCPQCHRILEIMGNESSGDYEYYCNHCQQIYSKEYLNKIESLHKFDTDYKQLWEKLRERVKDRITQLDDGRKYVELIDNDSYLAGQSAELKMIKIWIESLTRIRHCPLCGKLMSVNPKTKTYYCASCTKFFSEKFEEIKDKSIRGGEIQ